MRWLFSFLLLALASFASARSAAGDRLLVVVEDSAEQNKYSQFWGDLKARGFSITFEGPKSDSLTLIRLGERNYDHLIILPTIKAKGLGPALAPKVLLDFINKQGNILLALSSTNGIPAALNSLLLELDVQLAADRNTLAIDHFAYDTVSAAEQHDVLVVPQPKPLRSDVIDLFGGSGVVAFPRAVPQTLGAKSALLTPILRAGKTAYTYNPKEAADEDEEPFAVGSQISLVTAVQARNSARFTVFGSVEALEDTWFNAKVQSSAGGDKVATANRQFAEAVASWTFQESGVVRTGSVQHFLQQDSVPPRSAFNTSSLAPRPESLNPGIYRVRNDVSFMVELSQWQNDRWAPFTPPKGDDVQLEFTMLSPFHRLPLKQWSTTANSTFYGVSFETPDQHGIFSFRVNYHRPLLSNIEVKEEVTVRHFAHDEWPRSFNISGAWVWISGIWVTVAGWVVFVALWLYSEPKGTANRAKKNQ